VNADINVKNFLFTRSGQAALEIVLVRFEQRMKSEDILQELGKEGLRATELPEFLAFGATYPDVQRKFSVAGLGSVWRDLLIADCAKEIRNPRLRMWARFIALATRG